MHEDKNVDGFDNLILSNFDTFGVHLMMILIMTKFIVNQMMCVS